MHSVAQPGRKSKEIQAKNFGVTLETIAVSGEEKNVKVFVENKKSHQTKESIRNSKQKTNKIFIIEILAKERNIGCYKLYRCECHLSIIIIATFSDDIFLLSVTFIKNLFILQNSCDYRNVGCLNCPCRHVYIKFIDAEKQLKRERLKHYYPRVTLCTMCLLTLFRFVRFSLMCPKFCSIFVMQM